MILYAIFLVVGFLLFLFSYLRIRGIKAFVRRAKRSTGYVVRQEEIEDNDGIYYRPVFEFETQNNEIMEYRHWISSSNPKDWPVGKTQIFIYDPENPTNARFLNFSLFRTTVLLLAAALVAMTTGLVYFLLGGILL